MNTEPFVIERTLDAPADRVWQAITEKEKMKKWYFELESFRPEAGFEFSFYGGTDEHKYLHVCRITEVIPMRKLVHSWVYSGYPGHSVVTFELFPEGNKTRIRLTHAGLETFPSTNPDFDRKNFEQGWEQIIGTGLKEFVEKKPQAARP